MMLVVTTPFSGLLTLFVAMPLGIIAGIYGVEGTANLLHRRHRSPKP